MENIFKRHLNLIVLVGVLFAQMIGLAAQVKRQTESGPVRLIRVWAVSGVTPLEKAVFGSGRAVRGVWGNYIDLRAVREQNEELRAEVQRLRLEQLRLTEDTAQARRLQALLGFKEQFASQTLPAQVISTTGSEFSRGVYIDKGTDYDLKPDMPVITPDGIVGKILRVYPHSALVLEINDPTSGAGIVLQKSRLQGIIKGTPDGEITIHNIMADEKVEVGEQVLTGGGDGVFPKGLPVGSVSRVTNAGTFLIVTVRPAASLERVEEVLVVTKMSERTPAVAESGDTVRAVDVLAQRLPSVPAKPAEAKPAATPQAQAKPGEPKPVTAPPSAEASVVPPPARIKPPLVPDRFSPPQVKKPAASESADIAPAATAPAATASRPAADKQKLDPAKTAQPPKPDQSKGPQL